MGVVPPPATHASASGRKPVCVERLSEGAMKLTVDTNVLRDAVEPHRAGHAIATDILALHHAGKCEVRVTTRLDVDVGSDPLRELIASLDVLDTPAVGTVFRLDYSTLDGGDVLADEAWAREVDELMYLVFPGADPNSPRHKNRVADIDHLMGHKLSGRDVFVTNDKGILTHQEELRHRFGITVMAPLDLVSSLIK